MEILMIGGGGREHALILKLMQNKSVNKVYCLPGNGGISEIAECVNISAEDIKGIVGFCDQHKGIDMVVVAPDNPLAMGLVDILKAKGLRVFGPTKQAAQIESSKVFSKDLMKKYNIPTADYEVFCDEVSALEYLRTAKYPTVIKADGLAVGKGVIICNDYAEAQSAIETMMTKKKFGSSADKIVVEQFLKGYEVSILAFCDGKTIVPMLPAQDHKQVYDNDLGANTGGMGTICPVPEFTKGLQQKAYDQIILPTMNALNCEGVLFQGVIFFGLMVDGEDIYVLEYNARFGDPETQSVLQLLKTDLVDIFDAIIDQRLKDITIEWEDKSAVCVILASHGYPEAYKKGLPISFGEIDSDATIIHAGTSKTDSGFVTNGGRVLGVCAKANDLNLARQKAYNAIKDISFEGMHFRKDI